MTPLDDLRIEHGPLRDPEEPHRATATTLVAALLLLVALLGLGAWLVFRRTEPEPAGAAVERTSPAARGEEPAPLGAAAEPVEVPPLGLSDPFVRNLLKGLSNRPELAAWLAGDGLIRNLVVSVENVADGKTPSRHLRRLAPEQPFQVTEVGGRIVVDGRSYARYDGIADTLGSLDPQRLAQFYTLLKPRLEESYAELGRPGGFDAAVERAIVRLLETPVLPHDVELRQPTVAYEYRQPEIEHLSPAQKQLLRMGPRNVRIVQRQLREIARALGIPDERLPAAGRPAPTS